LKRARFCASLRHLFLKLCEKFRLIDDVPLVRPVAHGLALDRAGLPAAPICADAFPATAGGLAEVPCAPDYAYLTTPHPVAVLTHEQVAERARQLLPRIVTTVTAAPPAAARQEQQAS